MSVLMVASVPGDADDLAERYDRQQSLIQEEFGGPPPGFLFHHCAKGPNGLVIVNGVESEDTVYELRPRFQKTSQAVGLPDPEFNVYPLHNSVSIT